MTRARAMLLAVVGLAAVSSIVLAQGAGSGSAAPPPPAPGAITAKHFDHAGHGKRGLDVTKCELCHHTDDKGQIMAPAQQGHAPCLRAECHASDFVAVGTSEKTRKTGPAFDKAAGFCMGCHEKVPWPWKKATTRVLPSFEGAREYHIELNHFAHATRANDKAGCRGCHIVDATSFALVTGTPGHGQCVQCHNAKDFPDFTMAQCGLCHQAPAREQYFKEQLELRKITKRASRPATRVRSCGSEVYTRLAAKNPKTPCFKHERIEHRTEDGQPVQCAKCHYIVADKNQGTSYQSLVDLRVRPIIDNNKDRQHASCGRAGCHNKQVAADSCSESYCHADMSVY